MAQAPQVPFLVPHPAGWGCAGWVMFVVLVLVVLLPWAFLGLLVWAVVQAP